MIYSKHNRIKEDVNYLKSSIGEALKKSRHDSEMSVKQISDLLVSNGFKASKK